MTQPAIPPTRLPDALFRRRLMLTAGLLVAGVLLLLLIISAVDVLFLLFLGILLAVLLNGLSTSVSNRTGFRYGFSLAIVGIGIVIVLTLMILLLGPPLAQQFNQLIEKIPASVEQLRTSLQETAWGREILAQLPEASQLTRFLTTGSTNVLTRATGIVSNTLGSLANAFIVLFIGIYLAIEPKLYVENGLRLLPVPRRSRARQVLAALRDILQRWLLARFTSMAVVGGLTAVGLMLIGAPLALTLGIIAGLLSFIPNLGPILALIPAMLVAIGTGVQQVVIVFVLYMAVQAVESYLITPIVERRTVALPPAITLVAQLLLSVAVGFLGLLLAAPLVAALIVLVRMLYVEDVLGERPEES